METHESAPVIIVDDGIDVIGPATSAQADRESPARSSVRGFWRPHPLSGQWKWSQA